MQSRLLKIKSCRSSCSFVGNVTRPVDETYVKIKGRWTYLYRAVDKEGRTVDFLLRAKRDVAPAKASSGLLSGVRADCRLKSRSTVIRPHIAQPKRPWTNIPREINARSDRQNT